MRPAVVTGTVTVTVTGNFQVLFQNLTYEPVDLVVLFRTSPSSPSPRTLDTNWTKPRPGCLRSLLQPDSTKPAVHPRRLIDVLSLLLLVRVLFPIPTFVISCPIIQATAKFPFPHPVHTNTYLSRLPEPIHNPLLSTWLVSCPPPSPSW